MNYNQLNKLANSKSRVTCLYFITIHSGKNERGNLPLPGDPDEASAIVHQKPVRETILPQACEPSPCSGAPRESSGCLLLPENEDQNNTWHKHWKEH